MTQLTVFEDHFFFLPPYPPWVPVLGVYLHILPINLTHYQMITQLAELKDQVCPPYSLTAVKPERHLPTKKDAKPQWVCGHA